MTRLIDADALKQAAVYSADLSTKQVDAIVDAIDAAPTVCCTKCRQYPDCTVPYAHNRYWNQGGNLPRTIGCGFFTPREEPA